MAKAAAKKVEMNLITEKGTRLLLRLTNLRSPLGRYYFFLLLSSSPLFKNNPVWFVAVQLT
jgi:hypothetical protein